MHNNINIVFLLIQSEVQRISQKYNKDFLACNDVMKIAGLGRDNVRNLTKSKRRPSYIREC